MVGENKEKMTRISMTIPVALLKIVDEECKRKGFTRSEFIRYVIRMYFSSKK